MTTAVTYTKQQVFALAKKHDITIEGGVDRYWGTCECDWVLPTGKAFWSPGDRHSAVFEASIPPLEKLPAHMSADDFDVKNAKVFWTHMYEELKEDAENIVDCDCDDCTFGWE